MNTKSILTILFVWMSLQCFAQVEQETEEVATTTTEKKPKFWIGPKFGLDLTPITFNFKEIQTQLKSNYQVGILAQYGRTIYVQPEVYYASYKSVDVSDVTSTVNFIKVPVMLGLRFLNVGLFSLHVMGGPALCYQLDSKDSFSGNNTFGWQVGAGVDVLGFITTDLRYNLQKGVSIGDQVSQFNKQTSLLNLTVGLKLR